jgi:hypothetical protein
MNAAKHRATRLEDGEYEYRCKDIWQDESIPPGYWGRWVIRPGSQRFTTLKEAKRFIDKLRDGIQSA